MANAVTHTTAVRNVINDAVVKTTGQLGTGWQLLIYNGTMPANAQTALSGNTLMSTLGVSAATAAFGAAASAVSTVTTVPPADTAATGGTGASFFRLTKSDGTTVVIQGTAGTSGCDLNLSSTTIAAGANVSLNAGGTYTAPA